MTNENETKKVNLMNYGLTFVNGVLFGSGMILAAFLMKSLLHIGFCG